MGMFDTVKIPRTMPDGYASGEYQTKDLECTLAVFLIGDDDRLVRISRGVGFDEDESLPGADPVLIDFHGWLNVYDLDKDGGWHEYNAKFTDGKLVEIVPANV